MSKEAFRNDLKVFLEKHNVVICSEVGPWGDEKICFYHRISRENPREKLWLSVNGNAVTSEDI